jgi:hypothetical protein
LEITAGAVHPEEQEFEVPGYNVIEVSVPAPFGDAEPGVRVRVFHRDFDRDHQCFVRTDGSATLDVVLQIPRPGLVPAASMVDQSAPGTAQDEKEVSEMVEHADHRPPLETPSGEPDPSRLVRAAFQELGSGQRMMLLDRVGIDRSRVAGLPTYRQIAEVARISVDEGLVDAVLAVATELRS